MRIQELMKLIAEKKEEVRKLTGAKDLENAKKGMEELRAYNDELAILQELAENEKRDLINQGGKAPKATISEFRALTKFVMKQELTPEERSLIKSSEHAAVLPKQYIDKLQEIKKGFGSLKEYCDIIPVTKNEGTIPVVDLDQNSLEEIGEGDAIVDGTLVTSDKAFKCKKHGLIQTLTSEVIEDAEIELLNLVEKNFAEIVTVAENSKILKIIKDNAEAVTAEDHTDISKTMDKALPSVKAGLVTVTNTAGYAYLKNLVDSNGRNLNLITEIGGKYYFNSKELAVVDDELLPAASGKNVFYIANIKEAVKFCDRKAPTIAKSTEAGFTNDTVKVRILERFDVMAGVTRSLKKIEF